MSPRRPSEPQPPEPRVFRDVDEIDRAIAKLERRIAELLALDVQRAVLEDSGDDDVIRSNIRETIREVFGTNSPEFREHEHIRIWAGPMGMNMHPQDVIDRKDRGKAQVSRILRGLIERLQEKREEMGADQTPEPKSYFAKLNLHPV